MNRDPGIVCSLMLFLNKYCAIELLLVKEKTDDELYSFQLYLRLSLIIQCSVQNELAATGLLTQLGNFKSTILADQDNIPFMALDGVGAYSTVQYSAVQYIFHAV